MDTFYKDILKLHLTTFLSIILILWIKYEVNI